MVKIETYSLDRDSKTIGCSGLLWINTKSLFDGIQNCGKRGLDIGSAASVVVLKNPSFKGVKYERLPKGRSLTAKEAAGLLKACDDGTNQGKRDIALFALMLGCGLRRAECVRLEMKN